MSSGGFLEAELTRVLAATLTFLLTACAAAGDETSPSYSAGFADGCATASAEGTTTAPRQPQRDQTLYAKDPDYRAGWISGFATCRTQTGARRF
jgi:hypothetical protein